VSAARRAAAAALLALGCSVGCTAGAQATPAAPAPDAAPEPLRNWFRDPYFAVRAAVPECPVPRGPLGTEADMRRETHSRAERGTSCWLAGRCEKPNAYLYDAALATAVRERFAASDALRDASLWVTVQRRIVWVEGCVSPATDDRTVENVLDGLNDAERVIVVVTRDLHARPPYAALGPTDRILPPPP
jgi:hypothetical protein